MNFLTGTQVIVLVAILLVFVVTILRDESLQKNKVRTYVVEGCKSAVKGAVFTCVSSGFDPFSIAAGCVTHGVLTPLFSYFYGHH
jgi:hypothetical protein